MRSFIALIAPVFPAVARSRQPAEAIAEADAVLVALGAHPEHVGEVEPDGAVLGLDLVPALAAEGVVELGELLVGHPQGERRAGLEADADALRPWCQCPSDGWTISVSTPPDAAGCRKATREPRMPVRGCSSMSRRPRSRSAASVASRRPPGRRRGAARGRAWPGSARPASPRSAGAAARRGSRRRRAARPRRPARRPPRGARRPCRRPARAGRSRRRDPRRRRRCGRSGRTCAPESSRRLARASPTAATRSVGERLAALQARHALHDAVDLRALERLVLEQLGGDAVQQLAVRGDEVPRAAVRLEGQLALLLVADAAREVGERLRP